jgi:membrane-bound ClpP family serine protease
MKRHSLIWWLVILPTSAIVGGTTYLFAGLFTDWDILSRVAAALIATFVVDLATAALMESIAPTKVNIGPGEKRLFSESSSEKAKVICGFGASSQGRVSVRGETWLATRAPGETDSVTLGMEVNVVARDGLTLTVSAKPR